MKQFLKQHGKNILCIICVMMVVLSFSAGCSFGNKTATERIEDKADKINDLIKTYYLNDVDEENVEENIYKGILNGLDDPYIIRKRSMTSCRKRLPEAMWELVFRYGPILQPDMLKS